MNQSLSQIAALAIMTLRQSIRNRTFISLIAAGGALFCVSILLGEMAVGDHNRVVLNAGFWILGISGLLTSTLLGVGVIQSEFKTKIVYLIFSRPTHRSVYLLGKFTGMLMVSFWVFGILSLFFMITLALNATSITHQVIIATITIFFEWIVLCGFSLLLSTFVSPLFHVLFMVALYFIGHWSSALYAFSQNTQSMELAIFLKTLYFGFPNLEALNFRVQALYVSLIEIETVIHSFGVMMSWLCTCLAASILIITKRKVL